MPLTLDDLSDVVKDLQNRVDTLETQVKQYRQDILDLEQQYRQDILDLKQELSESVTTQKLVVTGEAQISGRNIIGDRQMLDTHEQRLNSHEGTLNSHEGRLNSHADIFNNHEGRLNELSNRTQKITCNGDSTMIDAGNKFFAIQGDGNLVVYLKGGGALWDSKTAG